MGDAWLEEIDREVCVARLRTREVGRLGIVTDTGPVIIPVNYALVEAAGLTWIAVRTSPGGMIDESGATVAFEIDEVGPGRRGWSILVRGTLLRVDSDAAGFEQRFDSDSWLSGRDAWLVIQPFSITGRELCSETEWAFSIKAYL